MLRNRAILPQFCPFIANNSQESRPGGPGYGSIWWRIKYTALYWGKLSEPLLQLILKKRWPIFYISSYWGID